MLQHLHLMQVIKTIDALQDTHVDVYQISSLFHVFPLVNVCLNLFVITVTGFDLWGAVMAMGLVSTLYTALVSWRYASV